MKILKHHDRSEEEIINQTSVKKKDYDIFEQEANCFARNYLRPLAYCIS